MRVRICGMRKVIATLTTMRRSLPHLLGHNHPAVNEAVMKTIRDGASLYGSGSTVLEGRLAELICTAAPFVDSVQMLNTGSEATYQAIRLARAVTGRDHAIVMQGGYNGWHNDVACNLMTPRQRWAHAFRPASIRIMPSARACPKAPTAGSSAQLQ